jgi:regulator of protease activity HflC (stomatin/prohibitin superfamily)
MAMADTGAQGNQDAQGRVDWRQMLITLLVGGVMTGICFIFGWWWVGTVFLLLTLFLICFAFGAELRPAAFTVFAMFAIAWLTGAFLDTLLLEEGEEYPLWRLALPYAGGIVVGVGLPILAWFLVFLASAEWLLSVSGTHDISKKDARRFVAARTFGTAQPLFIVENGKLAVDRPKGILSKLGGPGTLIVRSGNAVVLERGSQITRVVGPGTYKLKPNENFKQPAATKGIIDLRSRGGGQKVEDVLTKDGISLTFQIGAGYQIEPKSETDKRPESRFEGGEATTEVIGEPEYPVYKATILKAVNNTGDDGIKDMYPKGAVDTLRDIVASYTLDQIFPPNPGADDEPDPDQRLMKRIEDGVKAKVSGAGKGVLFKGMDIKHISMPKEVRDQWLRRWAAPVDRDLMIREAEAERERMIVESEGRARSIEQLDRVKLQSSARMVRIVEDLARTLPQMRNEAVAFSFLNLVRELAGRIGQDEASAEYAMDAMKRAFPGIEIEKPYIQESPPMSLPSGYRTTIGAQPSAAGQPVEDEENEQT